MVRSYLTKMLLEKILLASIVLLALLGVGILMARDKTAPIPKATPMKEVVCKKGEHYTVISKNGKLYKYCVPKITKVSLKEKL